MAQATTPAMTKQETRTGVRMAAAAWLLAAVYYFYQYALRSAPAVMMPELSEAFGLTALGVASIVGLFYYGYSPFSLVAGAAIAVGIVVVAYFLGRRKGRKRSTIVEVRRL